jgi:hypothetical protein
MLKLILMILLLFSEPRPEMRDFLVLFVFVSGGVWARDVPGIGR